MTRLLALDIGRKHTGVAYADSSSGVPVPLATLHHEDERELITAVASLVAARGIESIIVGVPLFLSGEETAQTRFVRDIIRLLRGACPSCSIEEADERWTNAPVPGEPSSEDHARAAVGMLQTFLERRKL